MADINKVLAQGVGVADLLAEHLGIQLDRMAADVIIGDEVEFHDSPKIVLPRGMTYSKAYKILERLQKEQETPTSFSRTFYYRPDDGANATFHVMKQMFGMMMGKPQMTFFGLQPAETRTIKVGVGKTLQVPWGLLEIPVFPGLELRIGTTRDRDFGIVFYLAAEGPKKYADDMEKLFDNVEAFLKKNSIYRGQAILGSESPEFMNLALIKPDQIIFSDEVQHTVNGTLWGPIRHADAMRKTGVPLKRALLAHGPFGTGKTSLGLLTALEAVANGWTFISAKPGRDDVNDVLMTAKLYQPAVVFVEDIDNATSSGEADEVTKFLDTFDGVAAKGGEIIAVLTTNYIERIHKGMLRPGRLDAVIEISSLDRNGIERLVKAVVPTTNLGSEVDFDKVGEAMEGFLPAFVKEAVNRSMMFSIDRLNGSTEYVIDTEDLVGAAHSLRPQLDYLNGASEGKMRPTVEVALESLFKKSAKELQGFNDRFGVVVTQDAPKE